MFALQHHQNRNQNRYKQGFTLLEVMVALAIFSVAALALNQSGMAYTRSVMQLRDKSLAYMVAMNEAAMLRLSSTWLSGTAEVQTEAQGQKWKIVEEIEPLANGNNSNEPTIQRIAIHVFNSEQDSKKEAAKYTLTVFLERPKT